MTCPVNFNSLGRICPVASIFLCCVILNEHLTDYRDSSSPSKFMNPVKCLNIHHPDVSLCILHISNIPMSQHPPNNSTLFDVSTSSKNPLHDTHCVRSTALQDTPLKDTTAEFFNCWTLHYWTLHCRTFHWWRPLSIAGFPMPDKDILTL